jgi:hypothetical protein
MNRSCLLLLATPAFCLIGVTSLGAASISTSPSTIVLGSVSPVSVTISVSGLYSFQFDISYDPAVLQLVSVNEGPFLGTAGSTFFIPGTIDNNVGTAQFTADTIVGPSPGASGSGALAVLKFHGVRLGTSPLQISNVTLLDAGLNNIAFTIQNSPLTVAIPEPGSWLLTIVPVVPWVLRELVRRRRSLGGKADEGLLRRMASHDHKTAGTIRKPKAAADAERKNGEDCEVSRVAAAEMALDEAVKLGCTSG